MIHVVFCVPYALEASLRFVRAVAALPGVRLGIISHQPAEKMPAEVRAAVVGYEVIADAQDPEQLTHAVRAVARRMAGRVDRLLGILEQLQVPLAQVRERLGIEGIGVEAAHNFRDKARMKTVLREAGLPCARHALAGSLAEATAFAERCGFPLVVKPPAGAGALNTCRVESVEQLEGYLRALPPSDRAPVLLEEFITGREHSFDSVSLDSQHVFHSISRYFPSPLEVMETPWIQWCVLLPRHIDTPEFADITQVGRTALARLGMVTGLSHMEWFRRDDGSLAISEVAARPPGAQFTTLLSHAHDFDFYRAWAELMVFDRFEAPARDYAAGAAFLRGQGEGRVVAIRGIEEAQREFGDIVVEAKLPRAGQARASSYEGEGYVILRHPDTERVERALARVVEIIQVELG